MKHLLRTSVPLALAALIAAPALLPARTKLVMLPERARLVVNLENPNHSLLYEEREIALQQGTNFIDFSWQGVQIDPRSIQLTPLDNPGESGDATRIINVAFPPEGSALTWEVYTPEARTERVRVSYLLQRISREFSYELTVNPEETSARFQQYFLMTNASGENLADARIRIPQAEDWSRTIASGEVRRFLASEIDELPLRKMFVTKFAPQITRGYAWPGPARIDQATISLIYEFDNSAEVGLGNYLLDAGKARLFGESPDGSTIFIGEDNLDRLAVGETAELRLGSVRDVTVTRSVLAERRDNEQKNTSGRTVSYDRVVQLRYEVQNFKDEAVTVRLVEPLPADAIVVEVDNDGVETEWRRGGEYLLDIEMPARDGGTEGPKREVNLLVRIPNVLN